MVRARGDEVDERGARPRASSAPSRPSSAAPASNAPPPHDRLREIGIGAALLVGLAALLTLLDALLREVPLARLVLGALLASVVTSRAHVVWDRDDPEDASMKRPVFLSLRGAAPAFASVLVIAIVSVVFGFATVEMARADVGAIVGVLGAGASAVRDELLYRAIPLHFASRAAVPRPFAVAFASLAGAIPLLASRGTDSAHLSLTVAVGLLAALAMSTTRSIWAGIGAHFAFWAAWGPLSQVAFVHLEWKVGSIGAMHSEGAPAWVAAIVVALVSVFLWSTYRRSPSSVSSA